LTDYQSVKNKPPLRLQLIKWGYLTKTQLADINLCRIARKHRELLLKSGEARTQRLFRFLAFVNQSDWLGKKLVSIIDNINDEEAVRSLIAAAQEDFVKQNAKREKSFKELIPDDALTALQEILKAKPLMISIIDAADNWVGETLREAGRLPNDNEWNRLKTGPLDGKIGMSFALQWRYNFGRFFGEEKGEDDCGV